MATNVKDIFAHFGSCLWSGPVHWGETPCCRDHGVYLVALPAPVFSMPVNATALTYWVSRATRMTVDGCPASPNALCGTLARFWHSDETILYMGRAGRSPGPWPPGATISDRVMAYYGTRLGASRPHRGGYWIKVLSCLHSLLLYWAPAAHPRALNDRFKTSSLRTATVPAQMICRLRTFEMRTQESQKHTESEIQTSDQPASACCSPRRVGLLIMRPSGRSYVERLPCDRRKGRTNSLQL